MSKFIIKARFTGLSGVWFSRGTVRDPVVATRRFAREYKTRIAAERTAARLRLHNRGTFKVTRIPDGYMGRDGEPAPHFDVSG